MGRSAKVHKRISKKSKASSSTSNTASSAHPAQVQQLQTAKKKATLKEKAKSSSSARKEGEHVLGDVDYVSLMMSGRRKAKQEVEKLMALSKEE
ncbi:hypothetical protein K435DRAFT_961278 [Dendrothele bispora CBS 962.96]|uniref:Uncharacterized protein n=1 Tax=Dendrothele bispora (strain CBS 962.96) TaxID=1314807 RepID=A0A4S8MQ65_DENBC|nr:hypothetical protein K435DRAFT_961278 [Dendrothele bispora CBS 962.96]